jgi:hypothetical protein
MAALHRDHAQSSIDVDDAVADAVADAVTDAVADAVADADVRVAPLSVLGSDFELCCGAGACDPASLGKFPDMYGSNLGNDALFSASPFSTPALAGSSESIVSASATASGSIVRRAARVSDGDEIEGVEDDAGASALQPNKDEDGVVGALEIFKRCANLASVLRREAERLRAAKMKHTETPGAHTDATQVCNQAIAQMDATMRRLSEILHLVAYGCPLRLIQGQLNLIREEYDESVTPSTPP